jgi:hypothetical protein
MKMQQSIKNLDFRKISVIIPGNRGEREFRAHKAAIQSNECQEDIL